MCCLFGILDCGGSLSVQQRTKLLSVLATQSEVRGRDATTRAVSFGSSREPRRLMSCDFICLMMPPVLWAIPVWLPRETRR